MLHLLASSVSEVVSDSCQSRDPPITLLSQIVPQLLNGGVEFLAGSGKRNGERNQLVSIILTVN